MRFVSVIRIANFGRKGKQNFNKMIFSQIFYVISQDLRANFEGVYDKISCYFRVRCEIFMGCVPKEPKKACLYGMRPTDGNRIYF
jgi:hypothetical protein